MNLFQNSDFGGVTPDMLKAMDQAFGSKAMAAGAAAEEAAGQNCTKFQKTTQGAAGDPAGQDLTSARPRSPVPENSMVVKCCR